MLILVSFRFGGQLLNGLRYPRGAWADFQKARATNDADFFAVRIIHFVSNLHTAAYVTLLRLAHIWQIFFVFMIIQNWHVFPFMN
jgi:hypothetical protein